jgi:asparagine synthase (glutamine-hydrolysing)
MGMVLEHWGNSPQLKRLGDFLQQNPNSAAAYRSFRGIFSHGEACAILQSRRYANAQQYLPDRALPLRSRSNPYPKVPSLEDEVSLLEISSYMRNQLQRDSDVMSMAWGLELRVPFVDRILLEAIASIESNIRLAPKKQLLIQAVPELPSWVVNRPKQGFSFPFQQWIGTEWQDYFGQVDCPKNIPLNAWYRRWSLAILQYWWQQVST